MNSKSKELKLTYFYLVEPFPTELSVVEINVSNTPEMISNDLGDYVSIIYNIQNNSIIKRHGNENNNLEPMQAYLGALAKIPESYNERAEWLGEATFRGDLNGKLFELIIHAGEIQFESNVNKDLKNAIVTNFSPKNLLLFIDEIYNLF